VIFEGRENVGRSCVLHEARDGRARRSSASVSVCGNFPRIMAFSHSLLDFSPADMGVAQTKDKDKGQSVTLDLKEKPLEKWLAEAKGYLKQIERLDISRQDLGELPPQIAKLVNLKFLQVYDNHLKLIPREIGTKARSFAQVSIVGARFTWFSPQYLQSPPISIPNDSSGVLDA